ncbi:MAG: IMPACT family protein [Ignavibacteria bacterium]
MDGINEDRYRTVVSSGTAEVVIKKSKFIGVIYPVRNRIEAITRYKEVCKVHHSAHHNCYAYSLGINDREIRIYDDGEPSGTAGRPIMEVIKKHNITNVIIVVTRYFGGIKLGTSGLIKAYSEAAEASVTVSNIVEKYITQKIKLTCDYKQLESVRRALNSVSGTILKSDYSDIVSLIIEVRLSAVEILKNKLINVFKGNLNWEGVLD